MLSQSFFANDLKSFKKQKFRDEISLISLKSNTSRNNSIIINKGKKTNSQSTKKGISSIIFISHITQRELKTIFTNMIPLSFDEFKNHYFLIKVKCNRIAHSKMLHVNM